MPVPACYDGGMPASARASAKDPRAADAHGKIVQATAQAPYRRPMMMPQRVYWINACNEPSRYNHMLRSLAEGGYDQRLIPLCIEAAMPAYGDGPHALEVAQTRSHQRAAREYLRSHARYAVVMEDHVEFVTSWFQWKPFFSIDQLVHAAPDDWEVLVLGWAATKECPRPPLLGTADTLRHRFRRLRVPPPTPPALKPPPMPNPVCYAIRRDAARRLQARSATPNDRWPHALLQRMRVYALDHPLFGDSQDIVARAHTRHMHARGRRIVSLQRRKGTRWVARYMAPTSAPAAR